MTVTKSLSLTFFKPKKLTEIVLLIYCTVYVPTQSADFLFLFEELFFLCNVYPLVPGIQYNGGGVSIDNGAWSLSKIFKIIWNQTHNFLTFEDTIISEVHDIMW